MLRFKRRGRKHRCRTPQHPMALTRTEPASLRAGWQLPVKGSKPELKWAVVPAERNDALASLPALSSQLKHRPPWPAIPNPRTPSPRCCRAGKESVLLAGAAGWLMNSKPDWKLTMAPSSTTSFLLGFCFSFTGSSWRGRSALAVLQVLKARGICFLHHPVLTTGWWGELLDWSQLSEVYMHTAANPL